MRLSELFESLPQFKVYEVKVKAKMPGYTQVLTTTLQAQNLEMCKRLVTAQFGKDAKLFSIREVKPQGSQKK